MLHICSPHFFLQFRSVLLVLLHQCFSFVSYSLVLPFELFNFRSGRERHRLHQNRICPPWWRHRPSGKTVSFFLRQPRPCNLHYVLLDMSGRAGILMQVYQDVQFRFFLLVMQRQLQRSLSTLASRVDLGSSGGMICRGDSALPSSDALTTAAKHDTPRWHLSRCTASACK